MCTIPRWGDHRFGLLRLVAFTMMVVVAGLAGGFAKTAPITYADGGFSCGPYATTYSVTSLGGTAGSGVRCLLIDSQQPDVFYWYGEGNWGSFQYRHIGVGLGLLESRDLTATASDMQGNVGGTIALTMHLVSGRYNRQPFDAVDVEPWHERWTRVSSVNYTPLPPSVGDCGNRATDLYVLSDGQSDLTDPNNSGSRCMLHRADSDPTVWFGTGKWGGQPYTHVGVLWYGVAEAADLCFPAGAFCNSTGPAGLHFQPVLAGGIPAGYNVSGAWSESWDRIGSSSTP